MSFINKWIDNYRDKKLKLIRLPKKILFDAIPRNDKAAFKAYPNLNKLRNRLWLAKSQGLQAGKMSETPKKFPVFVKPIDGAADGGGNRDCHFIKNIDEFNKYKDNSKLFWAQYLTGKEYSADIIMINGNIKFVLVYKIKIRKGKKILEDYKKVSTKTKLPMKIRKWISKYVKTHTGILNLQYRGDYIFEGSPRPDGAGRFLNYTRNSKLIDSINNIYMSKNWNWDNIKNRISKFYVFKVAAVSPFIIPLSYWTVRKILKKHRIKYYYFYTDISDNGKSFLCLISKKKKRLIKCRNELECRSKQFNMGLTIILAAQIFFYIKWIRDGRNILLGTTYISLTLIILSFWRRLMMSDSTRSKLTPFI